jgi:hypothetical protein
VKLPEGVEKSVKKKKNGKVYTYSTGIPAEARGARPTGSSCRTLRLSRWLSGERWSAARRRHRRHTRQVRSAI